MTLVLLHVAESECQRVIVITYAVQCVPALVQDAGITTTAAQRQRQSMHRDDKQLRLCVATANQHHRQTYASRRREQGRPCKDTTEQRQRQQNASRWREQARQCIATAATVHAPRQPEQRRLCIATANQRQRKSMHRDGESREHYASLRRRNGSDKHASRRQEQRRLCIV